MARLFIEEQLAAGSDAPLFDGLEGINIINTFVYNAQANNIVVSGVDADQMPVSVTVPLSTVSTSAVDARVNALVHSWALIATGQLVSRSALPTATSDEQGAVQLSTGPEALTGTEPENVITPQTLKYVLDQRTGTTERTGLVELATTAEAQEGTSNTLVVTPLGVKEYVANADITPTNASIDGRIAQWARAGDATLVPLSKLPDASESGQGVIEIATDAEASAGTDTTRAINAKQLAAGIATVGVTGVNSAITAAVEAFALKANAATTVPLTKLPDASTTAKGVVQLTNSGGSDTVSDRAATPNYVNTQIAAVPSPSTGLNQTQVDGRVRALVQDWAEVANSDDVPSDKLPAATESQSGVIEIADTAEAQAGTNDTKAMTAAKVRSEIRSQVADWAETGNTDDVPSDKFPVASTTVAGVIEVATDAEVTAGTSETVAVNPKQLNEAVSGGLTGQIATWALSGNSDDVPATKLPTAGIGAPGIIEIATVDESEQGTNATHAMTPALVSGVVENFALSRFTNTRISPIKLPDATTALKGAVILASATDVAGTVTNTTKAITPKILADYVRANAGSGGGGGGGGSITNAIHLAKYTIPAASAQTLTVAANRRVFADLKTFTGTPGDTNSEITTNGIRITQDGVYSMLLQQSIEVMASADGEWGISLLRVTGTGQAEVIQQSAIYSAHINQVDGDEDFVETLQVPVSNFNAGDLIYVSLSFQSASSSILTYNISPPPTESFINLRRYESSIGSTPVPVSPETGATIRDKLQGLTGTSRLDASAIKNLPTGGGGGTAPASGGTADEAKSLLAFATRPTDLKELPNRSVIRTDAPESAWYEVDHRSTDFLHTIRYTPLQVSGSFGVNLTTGGSGFEEFQVGQVFNQEGTELNQNTSPIGLIEVEPWQSNPISGSQGQLKIWLKKSDVPDSDDLLKIKTFNGVPSSATEITLATDALARIREVTVNGIVYVEFAAGIELSAQAGGGSFGTSSLGTYMQFFVDERPFEIFGSGKFLKKLQDEAPQPVSEADLAHNIDFVAYEMDEATAHNYNYVLTKDRDNDFLEATVVLTGNSTALVRYYRQAHSDASLRGKWEVTFARGTTSDPFDKTVDKLRWGLGVGDMGGATVSVVVPLSRNSIVANAYSLISTTADSSDPTQFASATATGDVIRDLHINWGFTDGTYSYSEAPVGSIDGTRKFVPKDKMEGFIKRTVAGSQGERATIVDRVSTLPATAADGTEVYLIADITSDDQLSVAADGEINLKLQASTDGSSSGSHNNLQSALNLFAGGSNSSWHYMFRRSDNGNVIIIGQDSRTSGNINTPALQFNSYWGAREFTYNAETKTIEDYVRTWKPQGSTNVNLTNESFVTHLYDNYFLITDEDYGTSLQTTASNYINVFRFNYVNNTLEIPTGANNPTFLVDFEKSSTDSSTIKTLIRFDHSAGFFVYDGTLFQIVQGRPTTTPNQNLSTSDSTSVGVSSSTIDRYQLSMLAWDIDNSSGSPVFTFNKSKCQFYFHNWRNLAGQFSQSFGTDRNKRGYLRGDSYLIENNTSFSSGAALRLEGFKLSKNAQTNRVEIAYDTSLRAAIPVYLESSGGGYQPYLLQTNIDDSLYFRRAYSRFNIASRRNLPRITGRITHREGLYIREGSLWRRVSRSVVGGSTATGGPAPAQQDQIQNVRTLPTTPTVGTEVRLLRDVTFNNGALVTPAAYAQGIGYVKGTPDTGTIVPPATAIDAITATFSGTGAINNTVAVGRHSGETRTPSKLLVEASGSVADTPYDLVAVGSPFTHFWKISGTQFDTRLEVMNFWEAATQYRVNVQFDDDSWAWPLTTFKAGDILVWNGLQWILSSLQPRSDADIAAVADTRIAANNARLNLKTIWTGTQAQYDAITTKDPDTLYFVRS